MHKIFPSYHKVEVNGYDFEIMKNKVLYQTNIDTKEKLLEYFKQWCLEKRDIDTTNFEIIPL